MPRYLVIQLARMGDALQSLRLVRTLASRGEVHLCVDRSLAGLLSHVCPGAGIHSVFAHHESGFGPAQVLAENTRTLQDLAALDFTHVYNLNHSPLNRSIASMFDASAVTGYGVRDGQVLRSRWLDLAFRPVRERRASPINLVDIWAWLAENPLPPEECFPVAHGGGRGLGIALAGRESRRSLPPEVLGPCVHAMFERLGGPQVWLFGSEAEKPLARQLMRFLPARVLEKVNDLCGKTKLADLPGAVDGLDCMLSPDTGLMHLAAVYGVPVHAVFLSSAWAWETGPYGLGHTVWQASADCAPCLESSPCGRDVACLSPFRSPDFLKALSGKGTVAPHGIWKLESGVDALGLAWVCDEPHDNEQDEISVKRNSQRALLAETLGLAADGIFSAVGMNMAETFYKEADWMLPDPLP